ncbi:MAG: endonuclease domain-containing protein [Hymenobacter sp.]|nr:MAG: endonuclease domain-containing protein [Hymenobacter sp.]
MGTLAEEGEGLAIFRNIVRHLRGGGPHPRPLPKREGSLTTTEVASELIGVEIVEEPAHHYQTAQDHVFTTSARQWQTLGGRAREHRKQPTEAEARLWQELRGEKLGAQFRRQHAIDTYIVDFVCMRAKLIVEADGGIHTDPEQAEYDAGRTALLQEYGFQVLRFTNEEILEQTPRVIANIRQAIQPLLQQS